MFHRATITPTKAELIARWAPTQPWGPPADVPIEVIGSYRFDDPDGRVGMETHLVTAGGTLLQVPLTYRDEPLDGADGRPHRRDAALGARHPLGVRRAARPPVRRHARRRDHDGSGRGPRHGRVRRPLVHRAEQRPHPREAAGRRSECRSTASSSNPTTTTSVVLRNDRFELTVFRRPVPGPRPAIGLTATWDGQPNPVVLAEVRER